MNKKLIWHTERRKVSDLLPYERNPRQISEHQLEILKASLDKFNLVELPAIDTNNTIVAGHQRIKALDLLGRGEEEIEVRVPNRKLTDTEYQEYLLTSNKSGGDWDYEILQEFDVELLLAVGFNSEDLSHIWDDLISIEEDINNYEQEFEKAKGTNIKLGDYFKLGSHYLICGDATNNEVVQRLLSGEKVDVVNTDIPYNIGLDYSKGIGGKSDYGGKTTDNKSDGDYAEFISSLIQNALMVIKDDAHIFFWSDERYVAMMQQLYDHHDIEFKRLCLWLKNNQNPTPSVAFNKVVEYCTYGVVGSPYLSEKVSNLNELMNKEISSGNRLIDDVLDLLNIWLVKRLASNEYEHPTQKPETLHEKFLRRCTKPGDKVLDLCAGSGSILSACEQMKRQAYLVEIEPIFCQVIINRFKKISHEKVIKLN